MDKYITRSPMIQSNVSASDDTLSKLCDKDIDGATASASPRNDSSVAVFVDPVVAAGVTLADSSATDAVSVTLMSKDTSESPCTKQHAQPQLIHRRGDLFGADAHQSLAHCISLDVRMGKGIAVLFKKKFGQVDNLKDQCKGKKPGSLAVLADGDRYIYYLLTKEKYYQKPTYNTLQMSLEAMKKHCMVNGITKISMPKIGSGLDQLQWYKVEDIIKHVFKETPMIITVYSL